MKIGKKKKEFVRLTVQGSSIINIGPIWKAQPAVLEYIVKLYL